MLQVQEQQAGPSNVGMPGATIPMELLDKLSVALGPEARSGHDKSTMAGRDAAD
jgi:hypothetical protein